MLRSAQGSFVLILGPDVLNLSIDAQNEKWTTSETNVRLLVLAWHHWWTGSRRKIQSKPTNPTKTKEPGTNADVMNNNHVED